MSLSTVSQKTPPVPDPCFGKGEQLSPRKKHFADALEAFQEKLKNLRNPPLIDTKDFIQYNENDVFVRI